MFTSVLALCCHVEKSPQNQWLKKHTHSVSQGGSGSSFNIETKTDGNGTISTKKIKAESGEEIMFTITPKEGYILSEVKVIDDNGNILTFTDNTFTMPSSDVTIEATFVPENPNTKDVAIVCCFIIIALGIFLTIRNIRKIKWLD